MKKPLFIFLLIFLILPRIALSLTWEMDTIENGKISIQDYKGKWVVVNFWATWCPPCVEEIPELNNFHQNNKNNALVLGINYEELSQEKLLSFVDEYFMDYPQFKMNPQEKAPIGSIPGLPTTFVITPEGEVVAKQVGAVNEKMLTKFISNWKE